MPLRAADLPEAVVGLLASVGQPVDQLALERPGVSSSPSPASRARVERDHHLAEHVGLPLSTAPLPIRTGREPA